MKQSFIIILLLYSSLALSAETEWTDLDNSAGRYRTYSNPQAATSFQSRGYRVVQLALNVVWSALQISRPDMTGADPCSDATKPTPLRSVIQNQVRDGCMDNYRKAWSGLGGVDSFQSALLAVNANFYTGTPYSDDCGKGLGVAIYDQHWVSGKSSEERMVHGQATDTLIIRTGDGDSPRGRFETSDYDYAKYLENIHLAISGHRIKTNGVYDVSSLPSGVTPSLKRARTIVGLGEDGNTITFITVNNGGYEGNNGVKLGDDDIKDKLDELLIFNALNLDGSGSAQLSLAGKLQSEPSDVRSDNCTGRFYRPVPVVLVWLPSNTATGASKSGNSGASKSGK